jgi:23S rRNA pseudouridine1911/1915/1917 synthase
VRSDGSIDEAIGRHRSARTRMAVRSDGRTARTHYQVKERFRAHTLLQLRLETGRTHQIRVHMAHLGHAVFGDPGYAAAATHALLARLADATPRTRAVLAAFRRQALHAERLRFAHPDTGRMLQFRAPLPADFRLLLSVLRRDRQRAAAAEER